MDNESHPLDAGAFVGAFLQGALVYLLCGSRLQNMMAKVLIMLFSVTALAQGIKYDGLRVKFGYSDALQDMEYFFKLPRTRNDAETEGWTRTERPKGRMPDLRLYCPPGRTVCLLYDTTGFVAGLQVALPVEDYDPIVIKPEQKFVKWAAPAFGSEPAREFWTATQYFVSEESLKAGAGPQIENGETLQDGAVWVMGLDNHMLRIPTTEAELNTTTFKKQNCFPNMGTHYYYNFTRAMNCDNLLPWFALITGGDLVGTGFQTIGRLPKQRFRNWFESTPTEKSTLRAVVPSAPDCLLDWAATHGILSLHIYYVNEPWKIRCRAGDSLKSPPPLDRIMFNGYRYAKQISDEVKKMFSG